MQEISGTYQLSSALQKNSAENGENSNPNTLNNLSKEEDSFENSILKEKSENSIYFEHSQIGNSSNPKNSSNQQLSNQTDPAQQKHIQNQFWISSNNQKISESKYICQSFHSNLNSNQKISQLNIEAENSGDADLLLDIKKDARNYKKYIADKKKKFFSLSPSKKKQLILKIINAIIYKKQDNKIDRSPIYEFLMDQELLIFVLIEIESFKPNSNAGYSLLPRILLLCLYSGPKTKTQDLIGEEIQDLIREILAAKDDPQRIEEYLDQIKGDFCFDKEKIDPTNNSMIFRHCVEFAFSKTSSQELKGIFQLAFEEDKMNSFSRLLDQLDETTSKISDTQNQILNFEDNQQGEINKETKTQNSKECILEKIRNEKNLNKYLLERDGKVQLCVVGKNKNCPFPIQDFKALGPFVDTLYMPHYKQPLDLKCFATVFTLIQYLNLWDCGLKSLDQSGLSQFKNLVNLNLTGNQLKIKQAEYLISHKWPRLKTLSIGFVDGSASFDILGERIKKAFPKLSHMYFVVNARVKRQTIQKYLVLRFVKMEINFVYNDDMLKLAMGIEAKSINLHTGRNELEEKKIRQLLQDQIEAQEISQVKKNQEELNSNQYEKNSKLNQYENNSQFQPEQNIQKSSSRILPKLLNDDHQPDHSESYNDSLNTSEQASSVLKPIDNINLSINANQQQTKHKIKRSFTQEKPFPVLSLQQKKELLVLIFKGLSEKQTFNRNGLVSQFNDFLQKYSISHILNDLPNPTFNAYQISILPRVFFYLMHKRDNTQSLKAAKEYIQKAMVEFEKAKHDQSLMERFMLSHQQNFEFHSSLNQEQNIALFKLSVSLLTRKQSIQELQEFAKSISSQSFNLSFDQEFDIAPDFEFKFPEIEAIEKIQSKEQTQERSLSQALSVMKKIPFYGNFFYLNKDGLCFCSQNQTSVQQNIKVEELVKLKCDELTLLSLPYVNLTTNDLNLIFNRWQNLKFLDIWNCKIATLVGSGLQKMQSVEALSLSNNPLKIDSVEYLCFKQHKWPKLKQLRITFKDGSLSWDLFMDNIQKPFPGLEALFMRETWNINQNTIFKFFALSEKGIDVSLRANMEFFENLEVSF